MAAIYPKNENPQPPIPDQETIVNKVRIVVGNVKKKYLEIEGIFNQRCSFFGGSVKFDINQLYITIVYWCVFLSTIPSYNIQNNPTVLNDYKKASIAKILPLLTFLYTICCQICQQNRNLYIWLILFIFLFLTPLLVLVDFHLDLFNTYEEPSYDYVGIAFCVLTILIFMHSLINRFILTKMAQVTTALIATLATCSFCVLISYGIIFQIICFVLLLDSPNEFEIINSIKDIIATPIFLILFLLSIVILKNMFKTQRRYNYIGNITPPDIRNEYNNYQWSQSIQIVFERLKIRQIALVFIIIAYTTLELYCYGGLIHEMSQNYVNYNMIITFSFLILAIPIYLMLIDFIGFGDYKTSALNFWIPILFGGISTFITVKIWNITEGNDYISSISRLIGICPLLVSISQLTVGYFQSNRQDQKMFIMAIFCYFFAFPLGLLLTLSDAFDDYSIAISAYTLMSIGLVPFALVVFYYLIVIGIYLYKLPKLAENLNFKPYRYLDLTNYAFWLNSVGYIISFHLICYYVWNEPETATGTKKGTLQGLLVLHTLLFLLTHKSLNLQNETSYSEEMYQERLNQLITAGIVFPFIILLPISLTQNNESTKNAILACAIGVPLVFFYFKFLLLIRKEAGVYRKFFVPLIVIVNWIFFISQIGVLFPILADYYENSTQEFAYFAQIAIAYTILIIIIGVTCVAIFYSVLLNKDYMEMKRRSVLIVVMQLFANYKIYASEEICSLIFRQYKNNDEEFTETIQHGDPVNIVDYIDDNFTKKLVTKSEFEYDRSLRQIAVADVDQIAGPAQVVAIPITNKITKIFQMMLDYLLQLLFCSYGTVKLQEEEQNRINKENELMQLNQWRDSKLNQNQNQEYQNFLNILFREIFYNELRLNKDKTEIFWYCIYQEMKEDLSTFLKLLNLKADQNILRQYQSFRVGGQKLKLDVKDFCSLLKDNCPEGELLDYDDLWRLAVQKYPIFIYNCPQLKIRMLQTRIRGSDFSRERFIVEGDIQLVQQRLPPINQLQIQAVQQEYQLKLNQINEKYDSLKKSQAMLAFWKIIHKIHEFIWVKPKQISNKIQKQLTAQLQLELPIANPQQGQIMPVNNWEIVSVAICRKLIEKSSQFDIEKQKERFQWKNTTTNIFALMLRLVDLYGLASLAFNQQVGWFGQGQKIAPIETVDYSYFWSQYYFQFFLAFFLSLTYIYTGIQVKKQIENDTFGLEKGQIATYKHKNFWLSKAISLISGQFIFVMKTYIDAFICDYNQYPYILIKQNSLECMSDLHFMYVVLAIVGCGIYYPLSTFLQPTFQYNDKSLDLKYKSSYLVLYIQSKLLILGLSSVFSNLQSESYLYQMLFSTIVMLSLIIVYYKIRPCYVDKFNEIEFCLLLFILFFYFGAFLIMASKSIWPGWICVIIFGCTTIIYQGYEYHKRNPNLLNGFQQRIRNLLRC